MANSDGYAGQVRRSQMVSSYGPGAIVDFAAPPGGHPVSGVISGLEFWDTVAPEGQNGLSHPQVIHEVRLQRQLNVDGFRLPPVVDSDRAQATKRDVLHIARFPEWLQCPSCHVLRQHGDWATHDGDPTSAARFCTSCREDGIRVAVVPTRFIVACENGHLDEFPWQYWAGCECERTVLRLTPTGPGLSGLSVSCSKCDRKRDMASVFAQHELAKVYGRCRAKRPWLGDREEGCDAPPRVLQRGGSTVYFAEVESALDIPPYSADRTGQLADAVEYIRAKEMPPEKWSMLVEMRDLVKKTGWTEERIVAYLEQCLRSLGANDDAPLTWEEFGQFEKSVQSVVDAAEFKAVPEPVPAEFRSLVAGVARATRLREVRVLTGFTRVTPPSGPLRGSSDRKSAGLSRGSVNWLPAVEIFGEGIFLKLDEGEVASWENRDLVKARFETLRASAFKSDPDRIPKNLSPRLVMIHSLAHVLIRQLSFECGYSSSALAERIYAGHSPHPMAGVLIHTGSPDADGTLGGLVRQGEVQRLGATLINALQGAEWCSSDPLCISDASTISTPENLAACHACLLVPETSCRLFNCFLDRAMLVGTPNDRSIGFFGEVLDMLEDEQ